MAGGREARFDAPARGRNEWRPDIQGLRAVAVLLVVLYHSGVLPGGYVGVDVFFVISGFMITQQLLSRPTRGFRLGIADFYARRIRRIIPVSAVTIVATVVSGYFVLGRLNWGELAEDGVWSSAFAMNVRLADNQFDYLRSTLPPSALQHFWSLGVEEQFYIVWPLIALVIIGWQRRWAVSVVLVAISASLVFMLSRSPLDAWRFYGLQSRAWQLLVGALLAFVIGSARKSLGRAHHASGAFATAAIVAGVILAGSGAAWPGPATVLLTLGTVLLLATPSSGAVNLALSHRALTWIGDRSYSWYLLHFPPLVFLEISRGSPVPVSLALVVSALTLLAAHTVYMLVEQPIRRVEWSTTATIVVGVSTVALLCVAGLTARSFFAPVGSGAVATSPEVGLGQEDSTDRRILLDQEALITHVPSNLVPALGEARSDRPGIYDNGCHAGFDSTVAEPCVIVAGSGSTVLLYGDSHAAQWLPALEMIANEESWELLSLTKSGCTPSGIETFNYQLKRWYTECTEWRESAHEAIGALDPDVVIVAGARDYMSNVRTSNRYTFEEWEDEFGNEFDRLSSEARRVVLIEEPPHPPVDVPACLADNLTSASRCTFDGRVAAWSAYRGLEHRAAATAAAGVVGSDDFFCGFDRCPVIVGNVLVYRDTSHMTTTYAASISGPFGDRLLIEIEP